MFNEKQYKQQFNQKKYSRLAVDLPKEDVENFKKKLKLKKISLAEFFRNNIEKFMRED